MPEETELDPSPPLSPTRKKMPLWFKLALFTAFAALIAVTGGILFTESLVDVIEKQLTALRNGDFNQAYHYTSQDFQATTSIEEFRQFIETYPIFLNSQTAHFGKRSIKDQMGVLRGHLTSPNLLKTPIEYQLVKEDNKWKILNIRLLAPGIGAQRTDVSELANSAAIDAEDDD